MSFARPGGLDFPPFDQERGRDRPDLHRDIFDPRIPTTADDEDFEERYHPEEHVLTSADKALFGVRIAIIVFFAILFILLILDIVRENLRIKCWRLYVAVASCVLVWLGLSIFQDHIDEYFVQEIYWIPQKRSIYWCFRNLIHGLTLYLILLLLSRLSDFQHRGWIYFIVFGVVLVPLIYSIALLIIDLSLDPNKRLSVGWNIAIDTVRVALYNVATTVICLVFAPRFCTRRQYGTYSDHRSPVVVLISRWTAFFLILHNLIAIASYGAVVASRVNTGPGVLEKSITVHRALEEVLLLLLVLCVPASYIAGIVAGLFCGNFEDIDEHDMELNKVEFYYPKVWTSDQEAQPTVVASSRPPSATPSRPPSATPSASGGVSSNPNARSKEPQNGAARKPGHGSNTTLESIDFTLQHPASSVPSDPPSHGLLAEMTAAQKQQKKRNRESYLEAVSTGSVNDIRPSGRVSTEPVDL